MKVIIIGGGPAGMMAAITAAQNNHKVLILEKMNSLGRKLLITGKGRCNITSSLPMEDFIKNVPGNGKFLYSAFKNFTNEDILTLLKKEGVEIKEERGNRIFPLSDKSIDVLSAFKRVLKRYNVNIRYDSYVKEILTENEKAVGVKLVSGEEIFSDRVILATGGKSYPATGSTGDGYKMAEKLGHNIENIRPSLVPLKVSKESLKICKEIQGLSLKNVSIRLMDIENNKVIYEDFGEVLFTHFGISGPTVLSASAHLLRYKNIENLLKKEKIKFVIDLKPALSKEKLNNRILRDFEKYKNKEIKNALVELLPQKIIPIIIELCDLDSNKKVNSITKLEREKIVDILKNFTINIEDFREIEEAIVTAGGISTKEINPKTMQSKLIKGLYFAGEIIDVDAYTGGFNLQIAYSTGYTAGMLLE